ncbi:MAG TPA: NDP-sugar synthase [Vicinamibacteria bacterium]|nr:NDP-sugar synthase [Vicinamibacteria bacterium]
MRAVILAGGEGTRLRPLTLTTPKPVVPVVDRPFLRHQLDLLAGAGVHEIVFSVAYRPEGVEAVFGDGSAFGVRIRYAVEETPLGTGGAVRHAMPLLDERTIVLNGDVLTDLDLADVVARHAREGASATIVLTPVPNPAAYGLVETDPGGRVLRFLEKPRPEQITTDTINAGIYVLETRVLSLMPDGVNHSIERGFFPALLARGDRVLGPVHRGYWIDIGTPEKYLQVHRDVLNRRFPVALDGESRADGIVHPSAQVSPEALLDGHFYVGPRCEVEAGARLGPDAVLVSDVRVRSGAYLRDCVLWRGSEAGPGCEAQGCLVGPGVRLGRSSVLRNVVLGEGSVVSDFSRTL